MRDRSDLLGARARDGDAARCAFLEQQLRRLDHRHGVEAGAHRTLVERVGDRDHGHALVVGHEGANDGDRLALGKSRGRVVEGFVPAEAAAPAGVGESREVLNRGSWIHHRRERRRIGRDHHFLAEPALQAESRDPEIRVLVGELEIARVVPRFRDAPGNAAFGAVVPLPPHDQLAGLFEQASRRRAHHERRHQVLEHRARPRDQRRAAVDRCERAPESEPVLHRHVALRDRDEAREPRLGGQQVVAARIERAVRHPVSDREQLPLALEEEAEVHLGGEHARPLGERREPAREGSRAADRTRQRRRPAPRPAPPRAPTRRSPPRSGPGAGRASATDRAARRA